MIIPTYNRSIFSRTLDFQKGSQMSCVCVSIINLSVLARDNIKYAVSDCIGYLPY